MAHAVLIVEDEATLAANIKTYLLRSGYEAEIAGSAEEGLELLDSFGPDAVLLDMRLPGMDGLAALARFHAIDPKLTVILATGHGTVETAVEAMKAGAYDFLTKPVSLSKLRLVLEKALGDERRAEALSYLERRAADGAALESLLGESQPMRELRLRIRQVLDSERQLTDADAPAVLISGETGVGKELVARALHYSGPRADNAFVEINCASIPAQLLESELFGYERGAFTDARERKLGLVETSEGGTLFLDEIGDMDLGLQAKLLKLLEQKTLRRIGSLRDQKVNVRIVAATHQRLESLVQAGRFRQDLYYRLRVVELSVPPLRERGEDIPLLAQHFLSVHGARYNKRNLRFSVRAERALRAHRWPGNVRELRNVVEQAVLLAAPQAALIDELSLAAASPAAAPGQDALEAPAEGSRLLNAERDLLLQALESTGWNVTRAAKLLGVSRDTLRYRIEKFQLSQH
jgi:DNA-binding NtrC family response regulator